MSTITETQRISALLTMAGKTGMSITEIVEAEIKDFLASDKRKAMLTGQAYYKNETDIQQRRRMVIGENGTQVEDINLANNKISHAFTRKLVDQKVQYLVGKAYSIKSDDETYQTALTEVLEKAFARMLKNIVKDCINKGIAWIHPYYNEQGVFCFKRMAPEEMCPLWKDAEHTQLDAMIRVYDVEAYEGKQKVTVTKAEVWDAGGVKRYVLRGGTLIPDVEAGDTSHVMVDANGSAKGHNWQRIPFVAVKYNDEELPLIRMIKGLVDDYDRVKSDNSNALEDSPNGILVLKNYDGQNLGEFRKNLAQYRCVKVRDDGGVDSISAEINVEAVDKHLLITRKDIYECGRGVDTQSTRTNGDPSGVALKFEYADLDMDCNGLETELQASFEQLLWFINVHLANTGKGSFESQTAEIIFNRDIISNEETAIKECSDSMGILSHETVIEQHPWITDAKAEMQRIADEEQRKTDALALPYPQQAAGGDANADG